MKPLLLSVLVLACLPLTAQEDEAAPFFSLTSQRTWMAGEKASVQLTASRVGALDFRVYRVRDPQRFFFQLDDLHEFGGRAPRPARTPTPLERFHAAKRRWQARVRNLFRAQYTPEGRARIRAFLTPSRPASPQRVTGYAQAPLLNPDQVVRVWRQPVAPGERWETQTIPVDTPGKGVYLVEAVHRDLRAYTILIVSDLAMMTKIAPGRVLASVVERSTGAPVPDAPVTLRVEKEPPREFKADAQGLADVPINAPKAEKILLIARRGDDFAVTAPPSWYLDTDPGRHTMGYVYSDRPVYRPGHPVHFKAVLRTHTAEGYRTPGFTEAGVEVKDSEDKAVFRKNIPLTPYGSVAGDLTLPASAALGYYNIEVHLGETVVNGGFQVEEYRKPEYDVRVSVDKRRVIQGQPVPMLIDARYFFGEPVSHAKVAWTVHRARYYHYSNGDEDEDSGEEDEPGYGSEQIDEQTGKLNADGQLRIEVPTAEWQYDAVYRVQARVTDEAGREVTGSGWALGTRGSFWLRAEPEDYFRRPGERARFRIEARDYEDKPVATRVKLELRQRGRKRGEYRTVTTVEGATDAAGKAVLEVVLPAGGSYEAYVTAETPEKRKVSDSAYIWAGGGGYESGARERIEIVPDKKSYRPGETARVLIVTGVPRAWVLFAVEGRALESARLIRAEGPTLTVDVPVRAAHQPNVYVTASFIQGNRLYQGSRSLKVPPEDRRLQVQVQPSKPVYKPGEPAEFTVEARDAAGRPAAAEFSLGIVDEAVYGVQKDLTPDILKFFYGHAWNRIGTESSLSYYFSGEAGKRRMLLTAVRPGAALAQLKPERLVAPRVRKAFPDTVYWAANLVTDASGRARARLEFPDSLTTWRATARGITRDTRVGSSIAKTIVRKNLILRLGAPRFLTQGDEVTIPAIVHNYLAEAKTARISLEVKGAELVEGAPRDVPVPSRQDARVDFRVRATALGEVTLLGKALTDEESDALELTLPVNPYGVKLGAARAGIGAAEFDLTFPAGAAARSLEISISPSVAGSLFGALEYLTSFPYGCTEQTMSSFLPNLVVSRALTELGVKSAVDPAALKRKLAAGIQRLQEFQHPDGGWGWWQTDESQHFMTAYVLAGLAEARRSGEQIYGDSIERASQWLRENRPRGDLGAYAAYAQALAGAREFEAAWGERQSLSSQGLAHLGLALEASGDARAGEIAGLLEARAKVTDTEAWWPMERDTLMEFGGDATPEATAYALKLLARTRPNSPLLVKAALWLVAHRREGAWWDSTKQTAMAIYGLTDYLKLSGELKPDLNAAVLVDGREVLARRFTSGEESASIRLDGAPGQRVAVRSTGSGRLYWSARTVYYSADPALTRQGSAGLNILREYFRLLPEKDGERIVYRLEPFSGTLAPGDLLASRLTLSGGERRYLMIEDPIPAGAEIVTRDEGYEIKDRPPWWEFWFTRREYRDDRAALFQTYFPPGQKQFFYLMKVVNPGTFRVSPARVGSMYQPQLDATTEGVTLEVK